MKNVQQSKKKGTTAGGAVTAPVVLVSDPLAEERRINPDNLARAGLSSIAAKLEEAIERISVLRWVMMGALSGDDQSVLEIPISDLEEILKSLVKKADAICEEIPLVEKAVRS